jgi:hypothetical protein
MQPDQPTTALDIQRHKDNPNLWEVTLRSENETHWVKKLDGFYLPLNAPCRVLCSCNGEESSVCIHARALNIHLLQQGEQAQRHRLRGLSYSGLRIETEEKDGVARHYAEPHVSVWENGEAKPLDPKPSQSLRNHSPDGFEWGYAGSGPSQLALAILFDYTGDAATALENYQDFKFALIAGLSRDSGCWQISGERIQRFLFRKLHATQFEYHSFHGSPATCYLQWIAKPQITGSTIGVDNIIVIANQSADVSDVPQMNCTEHLANQACRDLEIAPERLIWIEQYFHNKDEKANGSRCLGHFRLVAFHVKDGRLKSPQWLTVNHTFVENLIGQPLPRISKEPLRVDEQ